MGLSGSLLGLILGIMFADFHVWGIWFSERDLLYMSVRRDIAMVPKCLMWMFEMLSGPVAGEFLIVFMVRVVSSVEKVVWEFVFSLVFFRLRLIFLFVLCVCCWLVFA